MVLHSPDAVQVWNDEIQTLTRSQLNIPGLHMIGHAKYHAVTHHLITHFHYTMEFVVTLDGKLQFITEDSKHILYGGDMFMTYPLEPHGNKNSPINICEYVWFQFDLTTPPEQFLGLPPAYAAYIHNQLTQYHDRVRRVNWRDLPLLRDAFFLLTSQDIRKQILGYNSFVHFVINNIGNSTVDDTPEASSPIQVAVSYIHAHLLEDIPIELLAEHSALSPAHFIVKFKKEIGMTPHAYILLARMDTAKILLKNPDYSITNIAYLLNFSSSNHFANQFKKYTGFTPTEFRRRKFQEEP